MQIKKEKLFKVSAESIFFKASYKKRALGAWKHQQHTYIAATVSRFFLFYLKDKGTFMMNWSTLKVINELQAKVILTICFALHWILYTTQLAWKENNKNSSKTNYTTHIDTNYSLIIIQNFSQTKILSVPIIILKNNKSFQIYRQISFRGKDK